MIFLRRSNKYFANSEKSNTFAILNQKVYPSAAMQRPDGGIGRRAGLKHQWSNPCRFDPGSGYKKPSQKLLYEGFFIFFPHIFPTSAKLRAIFQSILPSRPQKGTISWTAGLFYMLLSTKHRDCVDGGAAARLQNLERLAIFHNFA